MKLIEERFIDYEDVNTLLLNNAKGELDTDYFSFTEYHYGLNARDINWKLSARKNTLIAKKYETYIYCNDKESIILSICSAFSFVFSVLIEYFSFIKLSIVLLIRIFLIDILNSNNVDKLTVFVFFGALVVLSIVSVCKKYKKNYFWITLIVSVAVTLLFVSIVNIYPEKTQIKSEIQYVTTNPNTKNTTVATKTTASNTTTVKSTTNVNKDINEQKAVNKVETVIKYSQVYTTTVVNNNSKNKADNKEDNIHNENSASKVIDYLLLALVILLSLIILFALTII